MYLYDHIQELLPHCNPEKRVQEYISPELDVIQTERKILAFFPNWQIRRSDGMLIENARVFLINKNVVLSL